jgi:hypothetical protein
VDRDGSPVREFAFWLRDLRRRSGLTYEQLGRKAHYATSTVQAATAGRRLPTLRVTMAVVRACSGDQAAWRDYWSRIRRMLDADVPAGASESVAPPWAEAAPPRAEPAGRQGRAESSAGRPVPGDAARTEEPDGWFTQTISVLVRRDASPVEIIERRTITATEDGLRELVTFVSLPRHPADLDCARELESELLYGGLLRLRQQPYDSHFRHVIELPRTLARGEQHEYGIRLRVPPGQLMVPHYVHVPFRRSDHLDLRVRFDQRQLPAAVWRLSDAPPAVIYGDDPPATLLVPDRCGEVSVSFHQMRPGLGYGVGWRQASQHAPGM